MRIAFFGTPEFAVPSLRALLGEGFEVSVVVTRPDRPRERSRSKFVAPPIKDVAKQHDVPLIQPDKPNTPDFIKHLREYAPDIGIVVAYGHILKPAVLAIPRLGLWNVHASLLPKLRGAAPIQHAIIQGLSDTGVSIMKLDEGMDTGPVLHKLSTPIAEDETGGELSARLAELGALALVEAVALLTLGEPRPTPQNENEATYASKIDSTIARIDWSQDSLNVARRVRALDPVPGCWSEIEGRRVQLFGPKPSEGTGEPGEVIATEPLITVATGDGALQFLDVQPSGGRRMPAPDWARGRNVKPGQAFR